MPHELTLKIKEQLTPDTHRYVFTKPEGIAFKPGQATEMTLMKDGWRDEGRPFTFTSLPDEDALEFVIKSYPDHDGVTEQLAKLVPGDTVEIVEPFGAITDHGPGVFIAAGAGITPFVSILDKHAAKGAMDCTLIFTNATEADIILREKWEKMDGLKTVSRMTAARMWPKKRSIKPSCKSTWTISDRHSTSAALRVSWTMCAMH